MRKLFLGLFCITTFIFVLPFKSYSTGDVEEEIKLFVGQVYTLSVNSPKRVAVGNPAIADVANISKSELTIDPKAVGNTTLVVWDNYGEQSYRLKVFSEDTVEIKRRIDNMLSSLNLPDVYTKAEDEEGKVLLLGSVKYAKDREKITTALAQVKDKVIDLVAVKEEEAVIEIDVQVIELDKGSRELLGFTWPGSVDLTEVAASQITPSAIGTSSFGKLFKLADMTRAAFTLKLDFLIHEGKARVLSRPRLSCQSGKEAKLVVGGEVPIIGSSATISSATVNAVSTTIEYKEYGIILNVKPQVTDTGRIHLNLDVSVSEVGEEVATAYAKAYKIIKRTATTELFLDDDQTMAIGGLIKKKSAEELKRVPWLSDIPVLGMFFRQRTTSEGASSDLSVAEDTELFITLTPHLVTQVKPQNELKPAQADTNIPSVSDDLLKDPVLKYSKIVQKTILNNIAYPAAAKESGFQGTVKLSLKLSHQGDLLDSKIKNSSGYQLLDDNAIRTAQEASPYPPFPPEIKEKEVWVDFPIIYQLE